MKNKWDRLGTKKTKVKRYDKNQVYDRKTIKEKPYFGVYFGKAMLINSLGLPHLEEEARLKSKMMFDYLFYQYEKEGIEVRDVNYIVKDSVQVGMHTLNASYACKYMLWGRAYKVMKYARKNNEVKHYKKCWINGRRRLKIK